MASTQKVSNKQNQKLTDFKKKLATNWKYLKKQPELAVSMLAVLLLIVGVFAAVLLASVEQDIRQQARVAYPVDETEESFSVPTAPQEIKVTGKKMVCGVDIKAAKDGTCKVFRLSN